MSLWPFVFVALGSIFLASLWAKVRQRLPSYLMASLTPFVLAAATYLSEPIGMALNRRTVPWDEYSRWILAFVVPWGAVAVPASIVATWVARRRINHGRALTIHQ